MTESSTDQRVDDLIGFFATTVGGIIAVVLAGILLHF
jgi:hypothetical protein